MAERAARDAEAAFGFIAAVLLFVDPDSVEPEERIPGVSVPIRAELRAGDERMGLLLASLPATRHLGARRPDAPRPVRQRDRGRDPERRAVQPGPGPEPPAAPAERGQGRLPARRQPQPADAADVDPVECRCARRPTDHDPTPDGSSRTRPIGCRGWSSSCSWSAGSSRSRPGRPPTSWRSAPRIQRAWDALAVTDRPLDLHDGAPDWLAVADGDQLDQVLWALLDNAVKYGQGTVDGRDRRRRRRHGRCGRPISDEGRGLEEADRAWLFGRFERGAAGRTSGNGSGLGLYVSRALMRGMGGDLVLDPVVAGTRRDVPADPAGRAASEG